MRLLYPSSAPIAAQTTLARALAEWKRTAEGVIGCGLSDRGDECSSADVKSGVEQPKTATEGGTSNDFPAKTQFVLHSHDSLAATFMDSDQLTPTPFYSSILHPQQGKQQAKAAHTVNSPSSLGLFSKVVSCDLCCITRQTGGRI